MDTAINHKDTYTLTKNRIVYTNAQLHIPGINTFAHHLITNAIPSLAWHYHENAFEFAIITKGTLMFSTRTSSYKCSGGDVFVAFPNEVHGTNAGPVSVGELYWFQLDISDENNFLFSPLMQPGI